MDACMFTTTESMKFIMTPGVLQDDHDGFLLSFELTLGFRLYMLLANDGAFLFIRPASAA